MQQRDRLQLPRTARALTQLLRLCGANRPKYDCAYCPPHLSQRALRPSHFVEENSRQH